MSLLSVLHPHDPEGCSHLVVILVHHSSQHVFDKVSVFNEFFESVSHCLSSVVSELLKDVFHFGDLSVSVIGVEFHQEVVHFKKFSVFEDFVQ